MESKPPTSLVQELLAACAPRFENEVRAVLQRVPDTTSVPLISRGLTGSFVREKAVRDVALCIRSALGQRSVFRHVDHISEWILERAIDAWASGTGSVSDCVPRIAETLLSPFREYRFRVCPPAGCESQGKHAFGPGLEVETTDKDSYAVEIRGRVQAYNLRVAQLDACQMLRELIGGLMAMGLARLAADPPFGGPIGSYTWDFELTDPVARVFSDLVPPHDFAGLAERLELAPEIPSREFEEVRSRRLNVRADAQTWDTLVRVWKDPSERGTELRTAAALFASASAESEPGPRIANYFMSLEGLLLEHASKADVLARLTEAIAYRIGRSATDRSRLRKQVRKLYDLRSQYVHTGLITSDLEMIDECHYIAAKVLSREFSEV